MPFEKGNHGRPKGALNRTTRDLRELALPYAIKGVAQLAAIAANVKNDPSDRIMAIRELLDRAYGKPKSVHTVSGTGGTYDLDRLNQEQLAQLEGILIEAIPNAVGHSD